MTLLSVLFACKVLHAAVCVTYTQESSTTYTLKCNINESVTYLHQGISLGLTEDREKNSAKLEKLALFKGTAKLAGLPPYLTVQMVRFFYKVSVQQKAKILKKVGEYSLLHLLERCLCWAYSTEAVLASSTGICITARMEVCNLEHCTVAMVAGGCDVCCCSGDLPPGA